MSGTGHPVKGKLARLPAHRLRSNYDPSQVTDADRREAAREYTPEALESEITLLALALDVQESICIPAQETLARIGRVKFWDYRNRAVAEAMHDLAERNETINPISVFDELKRAGHVGDGRAFPMQADFSARYPQIELAFTHDPDTYAKAIHRAYADRLTIEWAGKLAQIGARHVPGELASALQMMQMELSYAEADADDASASARLRLLHLSDLLKREWPKVLDPEIGLRERQLALIAGKSNSGKSLYVLMRLVFLAAGKLAGEPRHVVYLCGEGMDGIGKRVLGIVLRFGLDQELVEEHLHVLSDVPQLAAPEDVTAAILAVREVDEPISLIAIDTLATATEGLNENASDEMGAALGGVRRLGRELDCAVLLIHHVGKDETRGARGWTGLPGKMDVCAEVTRMEGSDIMTVRCTKMRDGVYFTDFAYRIAHLALDDYAEETTAVLESSNVERVVKNLSPTQQQVWDVLAEAGAEGLRHTDFMNLCDLRGIKNDTFKGAFGVLKRLGRLERNGRGGWVALRDIPEEPEA